MDQPQAEDRRVAGPRRAASGKARRETGRKPRPARAPRERMSPALQAQLRDALVAELSQVRRSLAESVRVFMARTDSELASLVGRLEESPATWPAERTQETMFAAAKRVKLKPPKGRLKDLVRLARLAELLAALAAEDPAEGQA